ncbi:hypothetical protein FA13DRAFT_1744133 [Coprinellus micaceus]|uniref:Uncharacterized protein n=1 Tax=Coprinellus micaceus TaxID=71717 RepID=A0A4Y7SDI8_COPMI|nr:hypothetical protein FA13DRAFT_1744133 [Coprinellus micaceus]
MPSSNSTHTGVYSSPKARRLQRLLAFSFVLSAIVLGTSLGIRIGNPWISLSFYTTPSVAGASIVFDVTLLSLTFWQARHAKANPVSLPPSCIAASTGANQSKPLLRRQLPCTVRKLSITIAIAFILFWLATAGCLLYFLANFNAMELGREENRKLPAPIVELLLNVAHAIIFGCYAVQSRDVREELLYPIEGSGVIGLHVLNLPTGA